MSATSAPTLAQTEMEQELEPKGTEVTEAEAREGEAPAEPQTLTPALSQREREKEAEPESLSTLQAKLAERLRQSERLPAGLRTRLAELIEAASSSATIEAAVRAVEDALPGGLRIGHDEVRRAEHPGGSAFFATKAGELSDAEADEIARGQLARAGLLRGQRVRVGD
jgi:hypothetical protein